MEQVASVYLLRDLGRIWIVHKYIMVKTVDAFIYYPTEMTCSGGICDVDL